MKTLFKLCRGERLTAVLAPFMKLLEALFELLVPLVILSLVDDGLLGGSQKVLHQSFLLLLLFALVGITVATLAQYLSSRVASRITARLRSLVFQKLASFSASELDAIPEAERLNALNSDSENVQEGINRTLRLLLRSPFVVLGALLLSFQIDRSAGLLIAGGIFAVGLIIALILRLTLPRYDGLQKQLGGLQKQVAENYSGRRVIRAEAGGPEEIQRFQIANEAYSAEEYRLGRLSNLQTPLSAFCIHLSLIVLLAWGCWAYQSERLSQGQLIALYGYLAQVLVELFKLARLFLSLSRGLASLHRLERLLALPASEPFLPGTDEPQQLTKGQISVQSGHDLAEDFFQHAPSLQLDKLSLCYPGSRRPVLEDLTFTLEAGEHLLILGGTSSGKSTLLELFLAFYPYNGHLYWQNQELRTLPPAALRAAIAYVPQRPVFFQGQLRDNLCLGHQHDDTAIAEALRLAAADFVFQLPCGLNSEISSGAGNFSGGERQRLAIARALLRRAPFLLLDNCSSALDFATEKQLQQNLKQLPWPCSILEVSDRPRYKDHPGRLLLLDHGRLAGLGSSADLLRHSQLYRELYEARFAGVEVQK